MGEQRHLIEEKDVKDFCNEIAGVGDNLYGEIPAFLHNEDRDKPIAELPTVPLEYQKFVRKPIDATVIKVGNSFIKSGEEHSSWNELITPVTINAGSAKGIRRDMTLHVLGSGLMNEQVIIKHTYRSTSRGVIVRSIRKQPGVKLNEQDNGYDDPEPPISVGMQLTTGFYKRSQDYDEYLKTSPNKHLTDKR